MRNWHHTLIRIPQARLLLSPQLQNGDSNLFIGVVEGFLEYLPLISDTNIERRFKASEYRAANSSLSENKMCFFRQEFDNKYTQDVKLNYITSPEYSHLYYSAHATSVASILVGLDSNNINIQGIVSNCNILNAGDIKDIPIITLTNKFVKANANTLYFKTSTDNATFFNENTVPIIPSDIIDNYNNFSVAIINTSINSPELNNVAGRKVINFMYNELFAYGRQGRGILVIGSAGNGDNAVGEEITKNNRYNAFTNKTLLVAASKLDITFPSDYNGNNPDPKEDHSKYSNYGLRVDLCAPSNSTGQYLTDANSIYASTNLKCGDIGANNESYINLTITEVLSRTKIRLSGNIRGVFPGQSIELGGFNSYNHELRHIKNAQIVNVSNQNFLDITFDKPLIYTYSIPNFNLVNQIARILVWKKSGIRVQNTRNRLKTDDLLGLQVKQEIYVFDENDYENGLTTIITGIDYNSKTLTVQTPFENLGNVLKIIPGQMKTKIKMINSKGGFRFLDEDAAKSFFTGQYVLVNDINNLSLGKVGFKGQNGNYNRGNFDHVAEGFLENGEEVEIKSLSYGDYTSKFGGTSASSPIVCGVAALLLSANPLLNAAEIKHILKNTAEKITGQNNYTLQSARNEYDYNYFKNPYFGAGRVNAEAAVQLALEWHSDFFTDKPKMCFLKQLNTIDIWISDKANVYPDSSNPYNSLNTSKDQNISIRVRNQGNRNSFQETDLRVLIAFTTEADPKFPFPHCWYQNTESSTMKTFLLNVKEVIPIAPNSESIVKIEWKQLSKFWNDNKLGELSGFRVYLLAHIAPFDGLDSELNREDASLNKNLTFREIFVTQTSNNAKGASGDKVSISHQQNKYNLLVKDGLTNEKFSFDNINIKQTELDEMKFSFSLVSRKTGQVEQSIIFKKNGNNWEMDTTPSNNWLSVNMDIQNSELYGAEYKNAFLNYEFNYDNTDKEINFNVTQS
ncbi:S8 family serine peptidase [Epilithonimonas arachidiradicis]|uniref:Subtilase family protein n=1 Tax=Epilithonimonas arachidiradicis TaxID=1617282 RepID=A0A420CMM8_9FLAO|nr:S8 family serine peptidase [Epilithonimonas arachidiradicis]RKE79652.1 subtilase family protein [Epilithonimonas arachidiradicis]GGG67373.1 hypothetical protein GCM10007332_32780 [Epilithonimonas arachidiradicis]